MQKKKKIRLTKDEQEKDAALISSMEKERRKDSHAQNPK